MLSERFSLHEADNEDLEWILALAESLAEVTVPPLRGVWGARARQFARNSITELIKWRHPNAYRFLIARDKSDRQRVGYLILNVNHEGPFEERESYIEDMGIVSEYLGKRAGHFLTDEAAKLSAELGIPYLGAHVSFTNRRALLAALGNGFELESYRIVRPCTEEAIQATKESEAALDRQDQAEKTRRALLSRRLKRRQRKAAREKRKSD